MDQRLKVVTELTFKGRPPAPSTILVKNIHIYATNYKQGTTINLHQVKPSGFILICSKTKKSNEIITSNQVKYIGKMGIKFKTINIFLNINNLLL